MALQEVIDPAALIAVLVSVVTFILGVRDKRAQAQRFATLDTIEAQEKRITAQDKEIKDLKERLDRCEERREQLITENLSLMKKVLGLP